MGFPFIKPLDDWMEEKLKRRETNQKLVALANPFVVLSSTAIATNDSVKTTDGQVDGAKIKDILNGTSVGGTLYKGCIISNQINKEKVYSTGATIVGHDFTGAEIKVIGETNRRVPQPIITSMEVNTDGANNSLKTANLKIKIFTLKQLEMFELFYLRPSMHCLVEFGSNEGLLTKKGYSSAILDNNISAKKPWTDFLADYNTNFSGKLDARKNYSKKIKDTDGNYDYVAGMVTDFKFTISDDLTYDVELEISSANTMMMWLPQTPAKKDSKIKQQNVIFDKFDNWIKKLEADLDINLGDDLKNEKWKDEFFNWQMIALKQDDTKASLNPYLSVRYILNLTNDQLGTETSDSKISLNEFYEDSGKTKPIVPINTLSSGTIISYSSDIIIPGKMPQFGVTEKKDKIVIKKTKDENIDPILNKINKYSFNLDSKEGIYDANGKMIDSSIGQQYGNLLNIFVKYDVFIGMWKKSTHRADFFNQLIGLINENLYGQTKLTLGLGTAGVPSSNTILDTFLKLGQFDEDKFLKLYRFKVGVSGSIVRGFEFNFELSNLAQGQAAFSSISMIDSVLNPKDDKPKLIEVSDACSAEGVKYSFSNQGYAKFDMSVFTNPDKFMSVDRGAADITLESIVANMKKKEALAAAGLNPTETPKKGEATTEDKNEEQSLNSKSVKFKFNASDTKETPKTLIYTDKGFLVNNLLDPKTQQKKTTSALTFLEITIILDGTSGINCGEVFKIDGVPEVYNMNGFFQVTNIKHQIENDGWKTIIEAGYRVKNG
jgi:hypothetical protein